MKRLDDFGCINQQPLIGTNALIFVFWPRQSDGTCEAKSYLTQVRHQGQLPACTASPLQSVSVAGFRRGLSGPRQRNQPRLLLSPTFRKARLPEVPRSDMLPRQSPAAGSHKTSW